MRGACGASACGGACADDCRMVWASATGSRKRLSGITLSRQRSSRPRRMRRQTILWCRRFWSNCAAPRSSALCSRACRALAGLPRSQAFVAPADSRSRRVRLVPGEPVEASECRPFSCETKRQEQLGGSGLIRNRCRPGSFRKPEAICSSCVTRRSRCGRLLIDDRPLEGLRAPGLVRARWRWAPGFHAGTAEAELRLAGQQPAPLRNRHRS